MEELVEELFAEEFVEEFCTEEFCEELLVEEFVEELFVEEFREELFAELFVDELWEEDCGALDVSEEPFEEDARLEERAEEETLEGGHWGRMEQIWRNPSPPRERKTALSNK